jgi:hypothetical protein
MGTPSRDGLEDEPRATCEGESAFFDGEVRQRARSELPLT